MSKLYILKLRNFKLISVSIYNRILVWKTGAYRMKRTVITCPRCGAEYLAQEIYLPTAFFGKANYIEKSEDTHKI